VDVREMERERGGCESSGVVVKQGQLVGLAKLHGEVGGWEQARGYNVE